MRNLLIVLTAAGAVVSGGALFGAASPQTFRRKARRP